MRHVMCATHDWSNLRIFRNFLRHAVYGLDSAHKKLGAAAAFVKATRRYPSVILATSHAYPL